MLNTVVLFSLYSYLPANILSEISKVPENLKNRKGEVKMLHFENDYVEGAHEKVLSSLVQTNNEKLPGYGSDIYCQRAKEKIKKAMQQDADIFF